MLWRSAASSVLDVISSHLCHLRIDISFAIKIRDVCVGIWDEFGGILGLWNRGCQTWTFYLVVPFIWVPGTSTRDVELVS